MKVGKGYSSKGCINCGAPLRLNHFMQYCPFCGYVVPLDGVESIDPQLENDSASIYVYIEHNENYILSNHIVKIDHSGKDITITPYKRFFPNDGNFHLFRDISISYIYTNDSESDSLLLAVQSTSEARIVNPYLAFLLNDNYLIKASFLDTEGDTFFFEISNYDLYLMCMSSYVDVSTNLTDHIKANYREFKVYSCRFYNQVFDRTKYSFSLNTRLLTDN